MKSGSLMKHSALACLKMTTTAAEYSRPGIELCVRKTPCSSLWTGFVQEAD